MIISRAFLRGFSFSPFVKHAYIDWVRIYDSTHTLIYNEEFDGCSTLDRPNLPSCIDCAEEFAAYFNTRFATNYTAGQVDSIYMEAIGSAPEACAPLYCDTCGQPVNTLTGMLMPGRTFDVSGYKYGFNGKENDNEVKGEGNQQDYGMRIYDPRAGRFLSVDPLVQKFPFYTPYQFAGNKPIWAIDLDGQEDVYYTVNVVINGLGQASLRSITEDETRAVHWYNSNKMGKLGRGELYTFKIEQQDLDGRPVSSVTTNIFRPTSTWFEKIDKYMRDESTEEKYGYVVYGNDKQNMDWQKDLSKASPESESIDLGDWLDMLNEGREKMSVKDLAEDFSKSQKLIKVIQKITQIDDAISHTEGLGSGTNDRQTTTTLNSSGLKEDKGKPKSVIIRKAVDSVPVPNSTYNGPWQEVKKGGESKPDTIIRYNKRR